jgi:hypothetical protein
MFQGSRFVDCTFEGELREVSFAPSSLFHQDMPKNEMLRVDFTRARFRWTETRGLDLHSVQFPADENHIVLDQYRTNLRRLSDAFGIYDDEASQQLTEFFRIYLEHAGPNQARGVLSKRDILEVVGESGLRRVLQVIDGASPGGQT